MALVGTFLVYTSFYYHADEVALAALVSDERVTVEETEYGWRFDGSSDEVALVFYPGGKVEPSAYAPLLHLLASRGVDACLVRMPFNLAFFDIGAAGRLREAYDYERWYVGGHSLGGVAAAIYAADHADAVEGLVLCAAYPTRQLADSLTVVSVYGSRDAILNLSSLEKGLAKVPGRLVRHAIEDGNHAQFGSYGPQDGDGEPTISAEEQRSEAVEVIVDAIG